MANLKTSVKDNTLTIVVDLSPTAVKAGKPSSTGKSVIIAGTGGFMPIEHATLDGLKLMVNVTIPT